jgi:hypothetical protein
MRVDWSAQAQLNAEGMAVQARTFMAWWDVRQAVRRLDSENTENVHSAITVGAFDQL